MNKKIHPVYVVLIILPFVVAFLFGILLILNDKKTEPTQDYTYCTFYSNEPFYEGFAVSCFLSEFLESETLEKNELESDLIRKYGDESNE